MAEAAGLVLAVVSLWQNCVSVFDVIDATRKYGMDYELLCVKLEVERVRLLCWGDAVGLNPASTTSSPSTPTAPSPDSRFARTEMRVTVLRLLGCIQQVFTSSDRLQERYGLRPFEPDTVQQVSQSQLILHSVFRRAYKNLRQVAQERQHGAEVVHKTLWAVHDRRKFAFLVSEVRGFNDSLESLFPDARRLVGVDMRSQIDGATEIRQLRLLQEAVVDSLAEAPDEPAARSREELSESVSGRLEALGVTASARSELLSITADDDDDGVTVTATEDNEGDVEEIPGEGMETQTTAPRADVPEEEELDELTKKMRDLEIYVGKKNTGALTLSVLGPYSNMEHVSAHVYWDQDKRGNPFSLWDERVKGIVPMLHASFELYRKKTYMKKYREKEDYDIRNSEDYVLFDVEAHRMYENVNPGTVTVEGFGMECWDFEYTKPRNKTIIVNHSSLPNLPAAKLLRRLDELRKGGSRLGWSPDEDELDIKEIVGSLGIVYHDQNYAQDPKRWVGDLYSVLNRTDIFADFTQSSSVGRQWANENNEDSIGFWNYLQQIIIAKELARRLDNSEWNGYAGFTARILASLIVSDLWLTNVGIILSDAKIDISTATPPQTEADKVKAEEFKNKGNEAVRNRQYEEAIDLYTEAIKLDLSNAVYRCNRSAASFSINQFNEAEEDAYVSTQLDPKYAKAWSRLGAARLKRGNFKRAKKAYLKALAVAGKDATEQMKQGLKDTQAALEEKVKAINSEPDRQTQHDLRAAFLDLDWDIFGKKVEVHSFVHERQVEGLLLFAQKMKWPYINEVRDYAEDVYTNLRGGETIDIHLHDWLYGIVLPGKWFSFKIMTALIQCTTSIKKIGPAHYYECGVSLPKRTYWRSRTVLSRVLGCLPGVITLCGWIGPCPAIEFEGPSSASLLLENKKPKHIRIRTRRLAPHDHKPKDEDAIIFSDAYHHMDEATRIRPDEEVEAYLADMGDPNRWIIPEPPVHQISTCNLAAIRVKKLPLDMAQQPSATATDAEAAQQAENETQYRASVLFKLDSSPEDIVTYKLFTNPVFVTLPPCRRGPKGLQHEVHMRELPRYQSNIWTVEQLKEHTPEDDDGGGVLVINATGTGAETLARAWCSERGKNAVIRRAGGPCFVCAVRAAGTASLGTGFLIWLD